MEQRDDVGEAVRVETAFTRFLIAVIGLEAALLPELSEEQRRQQARQTWFELESLPPDRFPNLIEAATHIATPFDPDRTLSDALDLIRAGIEVRLARKRLKDNSHLVAEPASA